MNTKKTSYREKLLDPRWQKMRLEIMERDGWTCQNCGATDKTLHAHHLFYRSDAEGPWDYDTAAILTLCSDCHEEEHEGFNFKGAMLIEAAAKAGFRTSEEMGVLHDILVTVGLAANDPGMMETIFAMIESHVGSLRGGRHGTN